MQDSQVDKTSYPVRLCHNASHLVSNVERDDWQHPSLFSNQEQYPGEHRQLTRLLLESSIIADYVAS
jgi:hypothetical protein